MSLKQYNQTSIQKREMRERRKIKTSPGLVALMILSGAITGIGCGVVVPRIGHYVADRIRRDIDWRQYENDVRNFRINPDFLEPYHPYDSEYNRFDFGSSI